MLRERLLALLVLIAGALIGYFVWINQSADASYPFRLGLDLAGGTHLVYQADVSSLAPSDVGEAMTSLRDVIERRVNLFGVAEPLVQVETGGAVGGATAHRLVVELPGVTDIQEAVQQIGKTPTLEFKLYRVGGKVEQVGEEIRVSDEFEDTGLTGRYLKRAELQFGGGQGTIVNEPLIVIQFDQEGGDLFEEITKNNVGDQLGIFLDGELLSAPVIREAISGGRATISGGNMTPDVARDLVRNLNFGALPLPIELVSTQTIGATLGEESLTRGVYAGLWGLVLVAIFMILWYRIPGVIAAIALMIYVLIMLAVFKLVPVTLTAAGIAGFILSIGMAVDANILIFERLREELKGGKTLHEAIKEGFSRAWLSIRDSNVSSLITAVILFWFGTSIVQGFAFVFGLGVLISMLSAISITRSLLIAVSHESPRSWVRILFMSGVKF